MPAIIRYPNVGSIELMNTIRTQLAMSTLQLFQNNVIPSPGMVIGDLTEATFTGYSAATITAFLATYLDPLGGASIQAPTQQFQTASPFTVGNTIYGWYLLTAGGVLVLAGTFAAPIAMAGNGDAIPLDVKLNFGAAA